VAKGCTYKWVDYDKTFSPVVKFLSLRAVLAVALAKEIYIHQMNIKAAFLN